MEQFITSHGVTIYLVGVVLTIFGAAVFSLYRDDELDMDFMFCSSLVALVWPAVIVIVVGAFLFYNAARATADTLRRVNANRRRLK